jgi:lipopolysaccharide export system protein LptA
LKSKIRVLYISLLLLTISANAEYGLDGISDYTGEAFFAHPSLEQPEGNIFGETTKKDKGTIPFIKQIRLNLQENAKIKEDKYYELAPTASDIYTGEVETSEYASKNQVENFEDMNITHPKELEEVNLLDKSDKKTKKNKKQAKSKKAEVKNNSENIILDCEKIDYDTENYVINATGNVSVDFVRQKIKVKADIIKFDRANNTIKAEGNVKIYKSGRVITGDYIFVDMNEETALIENPLTRSANIEMRSKKGYVYGDKIVQEDGTIYVKDSFPIEFRSAKRGPQLKQMLVPKDNTLTDDLSKGIITFQAKDIKIEQDGKHEIVTLIKPRVFKGDKLIFKTPSVKLYTNKNHDYVEHNHWEIGAIRGLGTFIGPGFTTKLPQGSVFKFIPMVNYKSGIGFGGVGRFHSGTNNTTLAYGSAMDKLLVYGRQELDDNLYLQYAHNAYMNEWFMGRRRPKYGISMVYEKSYAMRGFLLKNQSSSFKHRFDAGYFHNLDFDNNYEKIRATNMGTSRFKYMAEVSQNIYEYKNRDELKAFRFNIVSQLGSALYGTGDTQVIGRVGPMFHMQYKRWMQDIGYFFSVYEDNTPLPVFDAYRYGKQALVLREYFRVSRWLTLSWFGMINLSNDSPNGKTLQENGFYFSVGPDDFKLNLGYDFIREALRCTFEVMMDAKGTKVEYDRFEITQKNKDKKESKKTNNTVSSAKKAPTKPRVLERAIIENVKEYENVI